MDESITLNGFSGNTCDTITIDSGSGSGTGYSFTTANTVTLGPITSSGTISNNININDISVILGNLQPQEWKDAFPDWDRVQDMCKEYPALKIALEKLKTVYVLVKDDYDTPKDQRVRP